MKKKFRYFTLLFIFTCSFINVGYARLSAEDAYKNRLENVTGDFEFDDGEQPDFLEENFKRLMRPSRIAIEKAGKRFECGQPASPAFGLARSVAISDRATDVAIEANRSGSGYPDDLAGYVAFMTQRLFLELGEESPELPSWVSMHLKQLHEGAPDLYRDEDWAGASRQRAFGGLTIEWFQRQMISGIMTLWFPLEVV